MLDINIEYTALSQAVGDLKALGNELSSRTEFMNAGQQLLTDSQGQTSKAANELYIQLSAYHFELVKLVEITQTVMESIGIAFVEEENESSQAQF